LVDLEFTLTITLICDSKLERSKQFRATMWAKVNMVLANNESWGQHGFSTNNVSLGQHNFRTKIWARDSCYC